MKFTLSWLRDWLDTDADPATIADTLTNIGLEVEGIENPAEALAPFKVAKVLTAEKHPAVRAVLGHFVFVFIHPYADGNGRIGRFLMNAMLASGGYPWTVIRVARRASYMAALDEASTKGNITDFSRFIAEEMQVDWTQAERVR